MDRLGGEFGAHDGGFEPDRHSDPLADPFDLDDESAYEDDDSDDFGPPSPVGQDERRMQVRAYNLWASQLGDNAFPSIDTLDPESIEDFGPYSVLLDFSDGLDDPVLRHIGAELAKECSADDAMARLSDVPSRSLLSRITDHYMQILANQAPIGFEAEFLNERGNTALYRGILLPYSSEPDDNRATGEPAKIDFIYGVINWKELADQAMADELLLEIGQALEGVSLPNEAPDDVLELGTFAPSQDESEDEPDAAVDMLPRPSFGTASPDRPARIKRPALPTPDYAAEAENEPDPSGEEAESDDSESWAIGERASDYGLAEEWDEPDYEDVDDVVDPLADDGVGLGLASLVSRGTRRASEVIMPSQNTMGDFPEPSAAPIPQAYEPEPVVEPFEEAAPVELDHSEPEGLYDCLAEARDLAHAAQSSEDRSRTALYNAVGRAYDFSLEAQSDPEGFAEIIADNGLTVQDRAACPSHQACTRLARPIPHGSRRRAQGRGARRTPPAPRRSGQARAGRACGARGAGGNPPPDGPDRSGRPRARRPGIRARRDPQGRDRDARCDRGSARGYRADRARCAQARLTALFAKLEGAKT